MKKNYLLLIVFLLLAGATVWYLATTDEKAGKSTLTWDRDFAVKDAEDIHKIFIAKRNGETYTITRGKGEYWLLNGQHHVLPNIMNSLLEAVTNVTMKYIPTQAAIPNIVTDMAAKGIKVEVYGKNDKKLKSYYVGGVGVDGESTYFIMEDSDQPIACEIPQMVGHIRPRYDFTGDEWRDKAIFEYAPEDIQAVSIEYPKQRNKSFKVERTGNGFEVEPFYENVPAINRKVVNGKVEGFLNHFKKLPAEAFENQYEKKDSIRNTIPFGVVSVTDQKGEKRMAAFYPTYNDNATKIIERYFVDMSTGDWMLAQHYTFQHVFWAYEAFFEPAGQKVKD